MFAVNSTHQNSLHVSLRSTKQASHFIPHLQSRLLISLLYLLSVSASTKCIYFCVTATCSSHECWETIRSVCFTLKGLFVHSGASMRQTAHADSRQKKLHGCTRGKSLSSYNYLLRGNLIPLRKHAAEDCLSQPVYV